MLNSETECDTGYYYSYWTISADERRIITAIMYRMGKCSKLLCTFDVEDDYDDDGIDGY